MPLSNFFFYYSAQIETWNILIYSENKFNFQSNDVWFVYIPLVVWWGQIKDHTPLNEKSENQQIHDVSQ